MKKQLQQLRRFFVRTKKYNTTATRAAIPGTYEDEDDGGNRLSGAFIVVLLLHIIAVVGVFAFARIKDSRSAAPPAQNSTQTVASKTSPPNSPPATPPPAVAAVKSAPATPPPTPRETLKTPQPGAKTTHIVLAGETLGKIAFAYGISVGDLVTANKLKSQDDIKVGQSVTIPDKHQAKAPAVAIAANKPVATPAPLPKAPPATPEKKNAKVYTVQKGDTAAKIAREHGCTYEELVKFNNIKDPKKIQVGQMLKLPVKNG